MKFLERRSRGTPLLCSSIRLICKVKACPLSRRVFRGLAVPSRSVARDNEIVLSRDLHSPSLSAKNRVNLLINNR